MKDQAIAQLRAEMGLKKTNPYVQLIGEFLISHVESNPNDAAKLLVDGKSIEGSLVSMRAAAEKKKVGNMGILSDAEGYAIVLQHYHIKSVAAADPGQIPPAIQRVESPPIAPIVPDFAVSLDDFL